MFERFGLKKNHYGELWKHTLLTIMTCGMYLVTLSMKAIPHAWEERSRLITQWVDDGRPPDRFDWVIVSMKTSALQFVTLIPIAVFYLSALGSLALKMLFRLQNSHPIGLSPFGFLLALPALAAVMFAMGTVASSIFVLIRQSIAFAWSSFKK